MARQVSVAEAVRLLGISKRSVERRINDGTLESVLVGRRRLVTLPDDVGAAPDAASEATSPPLAQCMAECDRLRQEAATLRQLVAGLEADKSYLQSALAAALTLQQRVLPERAGQRPWWQFWKRSLDGERAS